MPAPTTYLTKGGKPVHRVYDVDEDTETGSCVLCGRVRVFRHGPGLKYWRCSVAAQRDHGRHYRGALAGACERCGFVPEHICQLDIHHLDGDHLNNDPANLATLCANCHRLVENPDAAVAWRPG